MHRTSFLSARVPDLPPPSHAMAVALRCREADIETLRSRVRLDSAFPGVSGGRSTHFPVAEESTRLATSSPFRSRSTWRYHSSMGTLLPPTRALFLKAPTGTAGPLSSSLTIPHVRSAFSVTLQHEKPDTARGASGDCMASGQINRTVIPRNAKESQLLLS